MAHLGQSTLLDSHAFYSSYLSSKLESLRSTTVEAKVEEEKMRRWEMLVCGIQYDKTISYEISNLQGTDECATF